MDQPDQSASILVVEDNAEVREVLARILGSAGYSVTTADDGDHGLTLALEQTPDLVVLDVGLPRRSGFQVAEELRRRSFRSPVLMLTARDTVVDRVTGLDAGADDYLAKPFDYDELLARVKALLRRSAMHARDAVLRVGDLELDPISRAAHRGERAISLTQKEYTLLEFLMRNAERPISRQAITEQVWKQPFDPATNIVDVYVNYLRRKLHTADEAEILHTVRGTGYMLKAAGGG
jgi:two-component system, OmpR family, response regulator MprA